MTFVLTAWTSELLTRLIKQSGWDSLLNRRSTSWRSLAETDKINLTEDKAIQLMLATPTLIKRPVMDTGNKIIVGFEAELYLNELISTSGFVKHLRAKIRALSTRKPLPL